MSIQSGQPLREVERMKSIRKFSALKHELGVIIQKNQASAWSVLTRRSATYQYHSNGLLQGFSNVIYCYDFQHYWLLWFQSYLVIWLSKLFITMVPNPKLLVAMVSKVTCCYGFQSYLLIWFSKVFVTMVSIS